MGMMEDLAAAVEARNSRTEEEVQAEKTRLAEQTTRDQAARGATRHRGDGVFKGQTEADIGAALTDSGYFESEEFAQALEAYNTEPTAIITQPTGMLSLAAGSEIIPEELRHTVPTAQQSLYNYGVELGNQQHNSMLEAMSTLQGANTYGADRPSTIREKAQQDNPDYAGLLQAKADEWGIDVNTDPFFRQVNDGHDNDLFKDWGAVGNELYRANDGFITDPNGEYGSSLYYHNQDYVPSTGDQWMLEGKDTDWFKDTGVPLLGNIVSTYGAMAGSGGIGALGTAISGAGGENDWYGGIENGIKQFVMSNLTDLIADGGSIEGVDYDPDAWAQPMSFGDVATDGLETINDTTSGGFWDFVTTGKNVFDSLLDADSPLLSDGASQDVYHAWDPARNGTEQIIQDIPDFVAMTEAGGGGAAESSESGGAQTAGSTSSGGGIEGGSLNERGDWLYTGDGAYQNRDTGEVVIDEETQGLQEFDDLYAGILTSHQNVDGSFTMAGEVGDREQMVEQGDASPAEEETNTPFDFAGAVEGMVANLNIPTDYVNPNDTWYNSSNTGTDTGTDGTGTSGNGDAGDGDGDGNGDGGNALTDILINIATGTNDGGTGPGTGPGDGPGEGGEGGEGGGDGGYAVLEQAIFGGGPSDVPPTPVMGHRRHQLSDIVEGLFKGYKT